MVGDVIMGHLLTRVSESCLAHEDMYSATCTYIVEEEPADPAENGSVNSGKYPPE